MFGSSMIDGIYGGAYEEVTVTSLEELDRLVSQRLDLPLLLLYSSDWNAAMQIVDKLGLVVSRDYSDQGEDDGLWSVGKDKIWYVSESGLVEVCRFALWMYQVEATVALAE